jgi:pimeloyl-ACP methyl ester carboxylesterase
VLDEARRRIVPLPERGVELALLDWGGDGPLALLHHANGFCAAVWEPVALGLRGSFRVVALDARGHGDSSKPEGAASYRWAEFGRDLVALAEALARESGPVAVGVGHSFGGTATLLAAAERPELFERLVLVDPVILPGRAHASDPERRARAGGMAEGARRRRHVFPDRATALASWRRRETFARWDPRALELYLAEGLADRPGGGVELKCPGAVEAAIFEGSAGVDAMAEAPRVRAPALVLWASRGSFAREHFEELARRMRDGRVREVDTGHFVPMEAPELVARETLAFSARPENRAAASPRSPRPASGRP